MNALEQLIQGKIEAKAEAEAAAAAKREKINRDREAEAEAAFAELLGDLAAEIMPLVGRHEASVNGKGEVTEVMWMIGSHEIQLAPTEFRWLAGGVTYNHKESRLEAHVHTGGQPKKFSHPIDVADMLYAARSAYPDWYADKSAQEAMEREQAERERRNLINELTGYPYMWMEHQEEFTVMNRYCKLLDLDPELAEAKLSEWRQNCEEARRRQAARKAMQEAAVQQFAAEYADYWATTAPIIERNRAKLTALQMQYAVPMDIIEVEYGVIAEEDGERMIDIRRAYTLGEEDSYYTVLPHDNGRVRKTRYCHLISEERAYRVVVGSDCRFANSIVLELHENGYHRLPVTFFFHPLCDNDAVRSEIAISLEPLPTPPAKPDHMTRDDYDRVRRQVEYRIHPESTEDIPF